MYALEGNDFHFENIIAAGEHPMLIDLETLFQPYLRIKGDENRPTLNGTAIDALAYLDQVITGFAKIYRLLSKHRTELLNRFLPSFAEDEIRVVLRPTKNYDYLLQESYHPTVLQNALDRERLFDHL